jgi:hypothetical protein
LQRGADRVLQSTAATASVSRWGSISGWIDVQSGVVVDCR